MLSLVVVGFRHISYPALRKELDDVIIELSQVNERFLDKAKTTSDYDEKSFFLSIVHRGAITLSRAMKQREHVAGRILTNPTHSPQLRATVACVLGVVCFWLVILFFTFGSTTTLFLSKPIRQLLAVPLGFMGLLIVAAQIFHARNFLREALDGVKAEWKGLTKRYLLRQRVLTVLLLLLPAICLLIGGFQLTSFLGLQQRLSAASPLALIYLSLILAAGMISLSRGFVGIAFLIAFIPLMVFLREVQRLIEEGDAVASTWKFCLTLQIQIIFIALLDFKLHLLWRINDF